MKQGRNATNPDQQGIVFMMPLKAEPMPFDRYFAGIPGAPLSEWRGCPPGFSISII